MGVALPGCAGGSGVLDSLQLSRPTHLPPSSSISPSGQKHPATQTSWQPKALPTQDGGQALPHSLKTLPRGQLGGGRVGGGRNGGGGGGIAGEGREHEGRDTSACSYRYKM